ncbi:MAG: TM2 domain protein [Methanoregula sp. PtaU1.Bin006]|nr:MAG: TM2 domain protein [Methanoregula sp. PtaB.Bin085]OPY34025.1 MAG: TM2 domain protein [Methanoregula sp. PtaU1.Bin006]
MDNTSDTPGSCGRSRYEDGKNQQVAVICSSLIPGLGQIYNGETLKGFAFLFGTVVGLFVLVLPGLLVWMYSMYDAHIVAGKMNEGTLESGPVKPVIIVIFILAAVFLAIVIVIVILMVMISLMVSHLGPAGNTDFFRMLDASRRLF